MKLRNCFTENEISFLRARLLGTPTDRKCQAYRKLHVKVQEVAHGNGLTTRALLVLILIDCFTRGALLEKMKNSHPLYCFRGCGYVTARELKAWAEKDDEEGFKALCKVMNER